MEGLIHGGAYFRNFTLSGQSIEGWAGNSKNGSQDWFRKQQIALTQTKLTMNPNSETIELRANKNLIRGSGQQQSKLYLIVNISVDYESVE